VSLQPPRDYFIIIYKFRLLTNNMKVNQLLILIAIIAGMLAARRMLGPVLFIFFFLGLVFAFVSWQWTRGHPGIAGRGFAVLAILTNTVVAVLCIYYMNMVGIVGMVLGSICGIGPGLGFGSVWAAAHTRVDTGIRMSYLAAWIMVIGVCFAPASMAITLWPLRIAFLVSKPAFDRLAFRIARGENIQWPEFAGLYRVIGSEVEPTNQNIGLVIDSNASGRSGFVRLRLGNLEEKRRGPFFNLDYDIPMGQGWCYQVED